MKKLLSILFIQWLFLISSSVFAQQVHNILVPGSSGPSLQQARDEFWQYHQNTISYGVWRGNSYIQQNFGLTWPYQMLLWSEGGINGSFGSPLYDPYTRFTAATMLAYVRAWRGETNSTRKTAYYNQVIQQAEYLLCLQSQFSHGGMPEDVSNITFGDGTYGGTHGTSFSAVALAEAYLTFGDQRYYNAVVQAAENVMNYPTYPYGGLGPGGNCPPLAGSGDPRTPCTFYSAVNHMALQLWHLSYAYLLTGSQRYLDRCLALAEEIMGWQDHIDNNDTWWSPGAIPDGGWYWYDFSASPVPVGSPTPPNNGTFNPDRKMGYHLFTLKGLLKLLEVTGQQTLPGTTTFRNAESFRAFKTRLVNSIIKATNYVIDNQETSGSSSSAQIVGGLKYYKDHRGEFSPPTANQFTSSPWAMETVVIANDVLTTYGEGVSAQDIAKLNSFVNGVSNGYLTHYTNYPGGWNVSGWAADGLIPGWGIYLDHLVSPAPPSTFSLTNPGFENKNIVWELWSWDGSGVEISSSIARSGLKSVRLVDNSTSVSKWAGQIVSAEANKGYTLSAYARVLSGTQYIYLDFVDQNFQRISEVHTGIGSNGSFAPVSAVALAPSGTKYIRIWLYADWYGTSEGYWDDVSLVLYAVSISGPEWVTGKHWYTYSANVSGGSGNFSYQWYKDGQPLGAAQQQSVFSGTSSFTMQCDVHDNVTGGNISASLYVENDFGATRYPDFDVITLATPTEFSIGQNYPNPFNPGTRVAFALPEPAEISITISDLLGRKIATLASARYSAGYHSVQWDGTDVAGDKVGTGIYFYRINAVGESGKLFSRVMKMLLAK